MNNYQLINESIETRQPYSSRDEGTYYTHDLFKHFCKNRDYKYVAIFGYYKSKYEWTDEEAQEMYEKSPDGWTDGLGVYRVYDWGRGENKISKDNDTDRDWHEPHLDHIVPKSKARLLGWAQKQIDSPKNMQVLPRKLNIILSNLIDDEAPALLPLIVAQFPGVKI
jgi:hypothetical protein